MKLNRWPHVALLYFQGLSAFNPIYFIFSFSIYKNGLKNIFIPSQLLLFVALIIIQFVAIGLNPHPLPISTLGAVIGLFAFAINPKLLFSWNEIYSSRRALRRILIPILFIYFLDSLSRSTSLHLNFVGFTDYNLKNILKSSTYLADDTNTLAVRVLFLYFITMSVGLIRLRPWSFRIFFTYLMASCYSRAGIFVMLFAFILELDWVRRVFKHYFIRIFALIFAILTIVFILINSDQYLSGLDIDSSVISKMVLVTGSIEYWLCVDWVTKLIGSGYYSNINVGAIIGDGMWASGHSIFYYAIVDFGVIGSLLIGLLFYRQVATFRGRSLLNLYCLIGLSLFRFDFLFLYITLFFVEHVLINNNNKYNLTISHNL
jgi:hypothetical protein